MKTVWQMEQEDKDATEMFRILLRLNGVFGTYKKYAWNLYTDKPLKHGENFENLADENERKAICKMRLALRGAN
jgi:hypothetical protein